MIRSRGRFHLRKEGIGQIVIRKKLADQLPLKHRDKVLIEYDEKEQVLRIRKL